MFILFRLIFDLFVFLEKFFETKCSCFELHSVQFCNSKIDHHKFLKHFFQNFPKKKSVQFFCLYNNQLFKIHIYITMLISANNRSAEMRETCLIISFNVKIFSFAVVLLPFPIITHTVYHIMNKDIYNYLRRS